MALLKVAHDGMIERSSFIDTRQLVISDQSRREPAFDKKVVTKLFPMFYPYSYIPKTKSILFCVTEYVPYTSMNQISCVFHPLKPIMYHHLNKHLNTKSSMIAYYSIAFIDCWRAQRGMNRLELATVMTLLQSCVAYLRKRSSRLTCIHGACTHRESIFLT